MEKDLIVTSGPTGNKQVYIVNLNGILPDEKLTPKMAARAAMVAFGHRSGVTVWDTDFDYGYRLYSRSARKLTDE